MAPKKKGETKTGTDKTGLEEMSIDTTAENEAIDLDIQNEDDKVDVFRSVKLEIDGEDVTKQFLSTDIFSKKNGTPQERMLFLFEQIKEYKKSVDLVPLIDALKKTGRKDLSNIIKDFPLTDSIINSYISMIKKSSDKEKIVRIILTWIPILIKSISDISLFGSLINLIPQIYDKEKLILKPKDQIIRIENTHVNNNLLIRDKVESILKGNINLAFFSSDLITAALSTYIAKVMAYPIQIISSTKRSGITTQTIIIQRDLISTLSIVMSYIDDIDKIVELKQKINNNHVTIFLSCIIEYILEFYQGIAEILSNLDDSNISENIQKAFDDLFLYQEIKTEHRTIPLEETKIELLCVLIYKISNISIKNKGIFLDALTLINTHFREKNEQFIVNRWTYHLSNDIFKYRYPLDSDQFNNKLKENISIAEILAATFDAMYGHDFPFNFMRKLGEAFLDLFPVLKDENKKYNFSDIADSNIESECINQTIYNNGFSTLNQHGDKFSIILGKNNNFLVTNKDEMYYRIPEKPWKITLSPLFKQKLYSSVDFVSGEPAISLLLVEQVNYIKSLTDPVYVFENVDEESIKKKFEEFSTQINKETNYNEIFNPCSLFDGAAPYGGKPIYFLEPYSTIFNFEIKGSKKYQFEIITRTNNDDQTLTQIWLEKRIATTKQINISDQLHGNTSLLIPTNTLTDFDNNVIKFNQIWGTILNSSNRISNDTKDNIIQKFLKIIGNINQEVAKLNNSSISVITSRSSTRTSKDSESAGNYFTTYDQFNNDKIRQMIEYLKPEFNYKNKITKTFEKIMNNYASSIIQDTETDYQLNITTVLSILEMCIRIIFISNTKGIFKALPDYSEIVINNEANKFGDLVEDTFTKDIKKFYKQLFVKFSALKQKRDSEALTYARNNPTTQSVTKALEKKLGQIANQSNANVAGTPILETGTSINQGNNVSGLVFSSSENSPLVNYEDTILTQIDEDNSTPNENKDIERLQNEIRDLEKQLNDCKEALQNEFRRHEEALQNEYRNYKEAVREIHLHTVPKADIVTLVNKIKECDEEKERLENIIKELKDKLKKCEEDNDKLKQQSEVVSQLEPPILNSSATPSESSFGTKYPTKGLKRDANSSPRRSLRQLSYLQTTQPTSRQQTIQPTSQQQTNLSRLQQGTIASELKRIKRKYPGKGGTFKQYQNKFKFSMKNKPNRKNISIKNNKRKHTKTYKRK